MQWGVKYDKEKVLEENTLYLSTVTTKINYGVDTRGKKRTSKKNVVGRCTSSHENKTFRSRSVAKQKRNGVWVPEDGDSCHKTGNINRYILVQLCFKIYYNADVTMVTVYVCE
jgi:hypothetical protein